MKTYLLLERFIYLGSVDKESLNKIQGAQLIINKRNPQCQLIKSLIFNQSTIYLILLVGY